MKHVVGVIDMDGFTVNGRFLCKELGLKAIGGGASLCLFDHGIAFRELSARDRRTAWFVEQHVHYLTRGNSHHNLQVHNIGICRTVLYS